jgi:hypothetical protein
MSSIPQIFKKIFLLLPIISFPAIALAQDGLNYGLQKPQDRKTLPVSRGVYIPPVLKAKKPVKTILKPIADGAYSISSGWELAARPRVHADGASISLTGFSTREWYNAVVPGTVLTSLVKQGVYPDPYFGLNNLHIPDSLCREDWWYRTTFIPPAHQVGKHAFININGINYAAEIWLNGNLLGSMKGAFKKSVYDVSKLLNYTGKNVLAVHILPPPDPGIPHEESPSAGTGPNGGMLCLDGPTFIATEGWDWIPGIRDRDMGIWQDVLLKFTGDVAISDPHVTTHLPLPDTTSAIVTIETDVNNLTGENQHVKLNAGFAGEAISQTVTLAPYERRTVKLKQVILHHPKLWWPNGYGNQALYDLNLKALLSGHTTDEINTRFGVRELSYEMTVATSSGRQKRVEYQPVTALKNKVGIFDNERKANAGNDVAIATLKNDKDTALLNPCNDTATAPYLVIKVNGKRIYCKGGNWGMDDAMKNTSREHLEPYFKLHKDAHFNMIRNWTGESTEQSFYDLCDEYGMLVWNDFWLSTQYYNLNVKDDSLFLTNAADVIKQYRNHPSIAIWCPRNEGYAPHGIESKLADVVARYDGTRYYQPNSRLMNLRTSGPWNYFANAAVYAQMACGFSTELGSPSVPTSATMRKMMAKEDLWPISDVWYYHDLHNGQKDYIAAMDSLYGKATSLDDFCKKAQLLNYDSYRAMFEGWQGHMWHNTSGVLLWMSHPAWPSTDWQTYSWDYETTGSYFGSMKACEPLHIQMDAADNTVNVINSTDKKLRNFSVLLRVYNLQGKAAYATSSRLNIGTDQTAVALHPSFPGTLSGAYLVRLQLMDEHKQIISENDYWKLFGDSKDFKAFNKTGVEHLIIKKVDRNHYQVSNPSNVIAIAIKLNAVERVSNQIILPAYFSEGYFNLLPGESKIVTADFIAKPNTKIAAQGYNIVN